LSPQFPDCIEDLFQLGSGIGFAEEMGDVHLEDTNLRQISTRPMQSELTVQTARIQKDGEWHTLQTALQSSLAAFTA
jgi:hypothetical protein